MLWGTGAISIVQRAAGWVYDNNRDVSLAQDACASWPERIAAGGRVLSRGVEPAMWLVPIGIGAKSVIGKTALAGDVLVEAAGEDLLFGPTFSADEMVSGGSCGSGGDRIQEVTFSRGKDSPPSICASSWPRL